MLSGENAGDFSDEVNILYGHHMRNGSMFALFAELRDSDIFNESPVPTWAMGTNSAGAAKVM